jgi:Fic family protein
MEVADFSASAHGRVLLQEITAASQKVILPVFYPDPLPETLGFSSKAIVAISEASESLGRLDSAISRVPNPELLIRPALRQEAQSTAALEGTHASLDELMMSEIDFDAKKSAHVLEVGNYFTAVTLATRLLERKPLVFSVINKLQKEIVRGTPDDYYDAGAIRQRQVVIGSDDRENSIRFVPMLPGDELQKAISNWEKWIHAEHDLPVIAKVALAHYQFETIHPYSNGNGRVGRLIIPLQLIQYGVLTHPALTLSQWLERNKGEYRDLLLRVSQTGDFDSWILFFAQGLRASARSDLARIDGLLDLQKAQMDVLEKSGDRTEARNVVPMLIAYPMLSAPIVVEHLGITPRTANAALRKLESIGLITEITGKKYARKWVAPEVRKFLGN